MPNIQEMLTIDIHIFYGYGRFYSKKLKLLKVQNKFRIAVFLIKNIYCWIELLSNSKMGSERLSVYPFDGNTLISKKNSTKEKFRFQSIYSSPK